MATTTNNLTELTSRIDNVLPKIIRERHLLKMVSVKKNYLFRYVVNASLFLQTIDEMLCWPVSYKMQDYDSKSKRRNSEQSGRQ